MARSRVLSAKFFTDEKLFDAEQAAGLPLRLAYEGLWCAADREGRFEWKPRELKLHVLPYDQVDFAAVLDALEAAGFIQSYRVGESRYGFIPKFSLYQRIHPREAASTLPEPTQGHPKVVPGQSRGNPRCPASTSTSTSTLGHGAPRTAIAVSGSAPEGATPQEIRQQRDTRRAEFKALAGGTP